MQFRKEKTIETHLGTIHISYIHIDNWSICINLNHFSNPLRPSTLDVLSLKTTKKQNYEFIDVALTNSTMYQTNDPQYTILQQKCARLL